MAGAPDLSDLYVGYTLLLDITMTVPAPKDHWIRGTGLSFAGFGAVILQSASEFMSYLTNCTLAGNNTSVICYGSAIVAGSHHNCVVFASASAPCSYHRHWLKELPGILDSAILVAPRCWAATGLKNRSSGQVVRGF